MPSQLGWRNSLFKSILLVTYYYVINYPQTKQLKNKHLFFNFTIFMGQGFGSGSDGKASVYNVGDPGLIPGVGKISWRRKWQPTPVFLPEKSHGWRSLVDYSPWGCRESDTTERLHFTYLSSVSVLRLQLIHRLGLRSSEGLIGARKICF